MIKIRNYFQIINLKRFVFLWFSKGYHDQVLLKVVNPNVDVNVDVDVTYVDFAFYLTSYLTFWRRFTSYSTCDDRYT